MLNRQEVLAELLKREAADPNLKDLWLHHKDNVMHDYMLDSLTLDQLTSDCPIVMFDCMCVGATGKRRLCPCNYEDLRQKFRFHIWIEYFDKFRGKSTSTLIVDAT